MYDYFYANEVEQHTFLMVPYIFFTDENLSKISNDAKILYSLCLNRAKISQKNKWTDKKGRVYIIFTIDEMCKILNKTNKTVVKIQNELIENGLLTKKKIPNTASRIFLKNIFK